ncbi:MULTISPECIES: hypothetical protein [unclassified Streptomyces]|uniref:hypothetical protein n=1 Tax=unclassified Streptomyces TaxID=2593676 RepID=UPI001F2C9926|nr:MULTISPECIES: hypothetical protein [unclassified Streptomyces]MCF0086618.1 hypothetical protein [Streptomyces sp. MH192]MCF0098772.1 hypothetical protein [Streptomyces sp. MH191]
MPANDHEQVRRDLNHWNAARHGQDRFHASNRRIAQRIARTAAPETTTPDKPTANAGK